MALDLNKVNTPEQSELGHEFELLYNGTKTGAFITIRGEKSKTVKSWMRRKFAETQQREVSAKARGRDVTPMTVEEMEDFALESAAIRVISWRGVVEGKEEIACTQENVLKLLRKDDSFGEQIIEESKILSNFIKG